MVGSESFCRALWRCDNRREESLGFEGRCWKRSVDAVVVEIGAFDRCGDIAKQRLGASKLLEDGKLRLYGAKSVLDTVRVEPVLVLEYLTARISHISSRG